ncbi:hypothetical protein Tco_0728103 [Tanacetum coccineum]|uniref:Reverse transcriptase domain-containing protein n=1 Tax=Tanacetum coccineum TaxID=301880 RepID=A0ABQ4YMT1_9ASTR
MVLFINIQIANFVAQSNIILVNVIPPDHVDEVPVVEPNQHDDVPVIPEHVLMDEDEDLEEEEFEEEEEPQEEEDDIEVDIKVDENEPELIYPYEEVDPLNPPPPTSESEPKDVIKVENTIESEDETVPASDHEIDDYVVARQRMHWLRRKEKKRTSIMCGKNGRNGKSGWKSFVCEDKVSVRLQRRTGKKQIIMVNVIPPSHVDDVPVVKPNQHDDVLVVPDPVLVDEDDDPEEDEFEEEEDPQEEEDDMEIDIEEDENEPELTYPYEEVDPLNPPPPTFESEPKDAIEVENPIEHEDETVPASVHEVGESSTAHFLYEDSEGLLTGLMRRDIDSLFGQMASLSRRLCGRETVHALVEEKGKAKDEYYGKLIFDLGNEVRSSVDQGTATMEKLVEKLGNAEDKAECKKLKKELEEARIMPPKSAHMTQAAIHRMIKENVDADIAAERARHANVGNDARGSGPVKGQDATPTARECTFAGFMKCNPTTFWGTEGAIELLRWFKKTESIFGISDCAEGKKIRFAAATLQGPALTWWNSKIATMGLETVNQMPWTKMKQLMTAEFCPIEEVLPMKILA